jgi:hypothetical protein
VICLDFDLRQRRLVRGMELNASAAVAELDGVLACTKVWTDSEFNVKPLFYVWFAPSLRRYIVVRRKG